MYMPQTIYTNLKIKMCFFVAVSFSWTDPEATKIIVCYESSFCKGLLTMHRRTIISMKSYKITKIDKID